MKINELVLKNRFVVEDGPVAPVEDPAAAPAATTTPTAPKPPAAAPAAKGPGLWDQIKQGANKLQAGIAGAKAGYAGSQAQQSGQAEAEEIGSMYFKQWNSAIGQNPALNTAANLQAFMQNSTKKSGMKVPPPPAGELNPAVTSKYIIDVIGKSFAASDLGLPAERQDNTVPQQPAAQQPAAPDSTAPVADPGFKNSTEVTPTTVTQQPTKVAPTQNADELIANSTPEELKALVAKIQATLAQTATTESFRRLGKIIK
jgi:hypothetical protein